MRSVPSSLLRRAAACRPQAHPHLPHPPPQLRACAARTLAGEADGRGTATATTTTATAKPRRLKRYHAHGVGGGADLGPSGSRSEAESHAMATDVTRAQGGRDAAPQPVNLLLAALIGCETATAAFVARKMRITIGEIRFDLSAWRDEAGALSLPIAQDPAVPSRLQSVAGTALVETDASAEEVAALAHQVHTRCPIANMISAAGCELAVEWRGVPVGSLAK